mgnify:CR=1 FL=1
MVGGDHNEPILLLKLLTSYLNRRPELQNTRINPTHGEIHCRAVSVAMTNVVRVLQIDP